MAARDRYGGFSEPATTPLQRYIQNACDPQNFEPNLALNLEIADLINQKKGNAPREAAVATVNHINNRNPNISLLALNLLDICVKNCGYPFHLQISTKEFLNELVRRFPERPPLRYSRVQSKILESIEEWRSTICQTSKYKEDLGFIRDMHRLLTYKGYVFPAIKREDAAVLNPSDNLRSAEEMEEEEKSAQSAKLQELIRRGTPHDLQEANRLMKVMAGFDSRQKTNYRAKAAEEVSKIQQKARILEEMLQQQTPGQGFEDTETAQDLSNSLASAHPKIQKMCQEESEDHEAVAKLFEINDSIHRTLERYRLIQKGDIEGASRIPQGTLGTSGAGVSKGPDNELSLIDFGGPEEAAASAQASKIPAAPGQASPAADPGQSLENDLLGLSLGGNPSAGGQISLGGPPMQSTMSAPPPTSSLPPQLQAKIQPRQPTPDYSSFHSASPLPPTSQFNPPASTPAPTSAQPVQSQPQPKQPALSAMDPFAALSSPSPRQGSPFQHQSNPPPQPPHQTSGSVPVNSNGLASTDDEWTFSSALPDQPHEINVLNSNIHVVFQVSRPSGPAGEILITSKVSNNTPNPISDLTFQAAITKSLQLQMEPQSSRQLQPSQRAGISQTIRIHGVESGKGHGVKVRWKTSYTGAFGTRQEQGEIPSLGIA